MGVLQLQTKDVWYYIKSLEEIKKFLGYPDYLKNIDSIKYFPDDEYLKNNLNKHNEVYLAPERLKPEGLFVVKNVHNHTRDGVKTMQQEIYNEDINAELYNRFGMFVSKPTVNFNDLRGFDEPKSEFIKVMDFIKKGWGEKSLSLFLGVSRSGKSYFAECLAGELEYSLIIFDIAVIANSDNPLKIIDDFFMYLEKLDKYVLLIDEIEKAVNPNNPKSLNIIGKLLTIFNNLNSESGFKIGSNPIIATANNITTLLNQTPEFINRFGYKYFVNYPVIDSFIEVADYYLKKMHITGITGQDFFNHSSVLYSNVEIPKTDSSAFKKYGKYASGEVKEFISNLMLFCEDKDGELYCSVDTLKRVLQLQKPQIVFAYEGVIATVEAGIMAGFREVN